MWVQSQLWNIGPTTYTQGTMRICPTSPHAFVDLENAFDHVPPVGGTPGVWGTWSIAVACPVPVQRVRVWSALPVVCQICLQRELDCSRAAFCHRFCSQCLWTEFLGTVKEW